MRLQLEKNQQFRFEYDSLITNQTYTETSNTFDLNLPDRRCLNCQPKNIPLYLQYRKS